jgi:glycosyltransferase involved in cell wall biosynthesis
VGKTVSAPIATTKDHDYNSQQVIAMKSDDAHLSFLYLTKYYPHKNIEGACEAVAAAKAKGLSVSLTITLSRSEGLACATLMDRITSGEFGNAVINIGPVDLVNIASVYSQADAVLAPTLLESYSATFLEAMKYKKPILTSDRDFSREICGDAAQYFEPLNTASMMSAIQRLHDDCSMSVRLIENADRRLQNINKGWAEISEEYLHIFKKVI